MISLLLLQAATAAAADPACRGDAPAGGEVVVCARAGGQEQFRLRPLPERYRPDDRVLPPRAEASIMGGKAKLAAETESGGVGGFTSNRAMVRLKVPF